MMDAIYFTCISALLVICLNLAEAIPPYPTWPEEYKSCVNVATSREYIKAGWYVDTENRRMRLDSYGIPKGMNASTAEVFQYYLSQTETFEYACDQYGPPLYIFIYLYGQGKMLSLYPSPDPPYRSCKIDSMYNKFPSNPLMPEVEFVEESHDNITSFNHWRAEFYLFTIDYLFHTSNGLPYKLEVNEEENIFISFVEEPQSSETFMPPPHVICK